MPGNMLTYKLEKFVTWAIQIVRDIFLTKLYGFTDYLKRPNTNFSTAFASDVFVIFM